MENKINNKEGFVVLEALLWLVIIVGGFLYAGVVILGLHEQNVQQGITDQITLYQQEQLAENESTDNDCCYCDCEKRQCGKES